MASGADEGRDKLRKATGSGTYAKIRRYPNGETRQSHTLTTYTEYIGICGEPPELKHLSRARKRNQNEIPLVVASERGAGQTEHFGVRGKDSRNVAIG